jgi:pimeloyl-ACP methyl ester carboxylesterase
MLRPLFAGVAAALTHAAPAAAKVPAGPAGTAFYTPKKAVPHKHGTPIWQRKLTGRAVLKSAKSNTLLLYSSTSIDGKPVAVSGDVAIPKGKTPKGGWPVISWAHGTTGIADACAPSLAGTQANYDSPLLNKWLKAGYAVVRTDYEGLGTPGPHPYLIGESEGRSVLDMVRAARKLNKAIGKPLVIAGHSQGGHAALWAASLAKKWTPELKLKGTVAFAPVSNLGEQAALLGALTTPSGITGLAAMILRGAEIAKPSLDVGSLLSDQARALYPQVDTKCLSDLDKPDSFGGMAPASLVRQNADLKPLIAELNANDPEDLKVPGKIRIEQGKADGTVFPSFTDTLVADYGKKHLAVTYKTWPGVDHGGAVTNRKPSGDATKFVKRALG